MISIIPKLSQHQSVSSNIDAQNLKRDSQVKIESLHSLFVEKTNFQISSRNSRDLLDILGLLPASPWGKDRYALRKQCDFLRRIPLKGWNRLLDDIAAINFRLLTKDVLEAFKLGEWDHPIFEHDFWPLLAFYAYLEGALKEEYLPKLLLYDTCKREGAKEYGMRTYQLIRADGKINPNILYEIEKGLRDYFLPATINILAQNMRKLPPSESQFFKVKQLGEHTGLFSVAKDTFGPFLHQCPIPSEFIQIVIPPKLAHEIIKARFPKTAKMPHPVLGYFQKEKLSYLDRRVVSLSFRDYVKLPETVHTIPTNSLGCYHHDCLYHLFIDSANIHKAVWNELAQFFIEQQEYDLGITAFDGEFSAYLETIRETSPAIESIYEVALERPHELFWGSLIFDLLANSGDESSQIRASIKLSLFWDYFTAHSEEWDRKYGLNISNLKEFLKKIGNYIEKPTTYFDPTKFVASEMAKKAGLQQELHLN